MFYPSGKNKIHLLFTMTVLLFIAGQSGNSYAQGPAPDNFTIDPVNSIATWNVPDTSNSGELLGYMTFIDGNTIAIITDTVFDYGYFWYGSTHVAGVASVYNTGLSDTIEEEFVSEYLIPPTNLEGTETELHAYLSWDHPIYIENKKLNPDSIPANLLGYNIYRDGDSIDRVYYPTNEYWDDPVGPFIGTHNYSIKAVYLLIPYGFPGQTGNSGEEGPVEVIIASCCGLPFLDDFSSGTFTQWYDVYCDNWIINQNSGNPAPAAQFQAHDTLIDYFCGFETWDMGRDYEDIIIEMEFDLKLDDISASGTEYFKLFIHSPDTMYEAFQISNNGSFGWTHFVVDVSEFTRNNPDYTFYFAANGENGSNISNWLLDNIEARLYCPAPYDLIAELEPPYVHLEWQSPDTMSGGKNRELAGYHIYREENNSGEWDLLNENPIPETTYTDELDENAFYAYFVKVVFNISEAEICTSDSSNNAHVSAYAGMKEQTQQNGIRIYPNPAHEKIKVVSQWEIKSLQLINAMGKIIHRINNPGKNSINIALDGLTGGLYYLEVKGQHQHAVKKIMISP